MNDKKGIALPINMLVILSISIIVLLAVVAFFMSGFQTGAIDDQTIVNECCSPVSRDPDLCNKESWTGLHDGDGKVEIGGETKSCSEVLESPAKCPSCNF